MCKYPKPLKWRAARKRARALTIEMKAAWSRIPQKSRRTVLRSHARFMLFKNHIENSKSLAPDVYGRLINDMVLNLAEIHKVADGPPSGSN